MFLEPAQFSAAKRYWRAAVNDSCSRLRSFKDCTYWTDSCITLYQMIFVVEKRTCVDGRVGSRQDSGAVWQRQVGAQCPKQTHFTQQCFSNQFGMRAFANHVTSPTQCLHQTARHTTVRRAGFRRSACARAGAVFWPGTLALGTSFLRSAGWWQMTADDGR